MADIFTDLKKEIAEREFKPIVVSPKRIRDRKWKKTPAGKAAAKRYEKTESAKAKHKKWNQSEAGKASSKKRCKKYAQDHPEKMREKAKRHYALHREEILARRREQRIAKKEAKNAA